MQTTYKKYGYRIHYSKTKDTWEVLKGKEIVAEFTMRSDAWEWVKSNKIQ